MIDPRSQYIIYKEQENNRMKQIEWKLAAQAKGGCQATEPPWYSVTVQWLKENVFSRGSAKRQRFATESPCQG
jgi:hypothetical protein